MFSLFGGTKPTTDPVTLNPQNPAFDEALQKESFSIKGVEYTRCALVATTPAHTKAKKLTSAIWKGGEALLCSKDSKRYFYCYYCELSGHDQPLPSCHDGNSSALNHLAKKHQLDKVSGEPMVGGSALKNSFQHGVVYQQLTKTYAVNEFKDLLVRWMVYCHVAFRMVENEYFRDLINFLSSLMGGFLPRAASTIRGWIMEAYAKEKVAVERELRVAVSSIHLSFDGWTSPNNYSILSVYAHFVDSGGTRRSRLLAFRRTYGAKSAENEAAALMEVIVEYRLEQRLEYFMCDNIGTNTALIDLLLKQLYPHWTQKQRLARRLRCLGHVANLCTRALLLGKGAGKALAALQAKIEKGAVDAVEAFWAQKGPVGMLHNTVRFIRGSPQRIERFAGVVVGGMLSQFDGKKLIQDNDTRWNSTYCMITRALKLKERIERFVKDWLKQKEHKDEKALKDNRLKAQHWKQLDRIHDALATFEVATMDSQGNEKSLHDWYPTISFLLDTMDGFKTEFAEEAAGDPSFEYISRCCDHAWYKVEKYYTLCDDTPILYAAVYLNPLLKKQWFDSQWTQDSQAKWSSTVYEQVIELWSEYKDSTPPLPAALAPPPTEDSVHSRMRKYKRIKTSHRAASSVVDEMTEYLTTDPLPDPQWASGEYNAAIPAFNHLHWWFQRRRQWPALSRMAFDCLSIPLMSDNPERSFSSGRDMITYRRSQLKGDIIEACAFLRSAYGPPVKLRAGGVAEPAFDDESEVDADLQRRQTDQSYQQSFMSSTVVDSQSQSDDLYS